jgi:hypothetical protein
VPSSGIINLGAAKWHRIPVYGGDTKKVATAAAGKYPQMTLASL